MKMISCAEPLHPLRHTARKLSRQDANWGSRFGIIYLRRYFLDILVFPLGYSSLLYRLDKPPFVLRCVLAGLVAAFEFEPDVLGAQIKRVANGHEGESPIGVIAE